MKSYPHVFEPIVLGRTRFKNRIFAAPLGLEYYPGDNCHPGDDFIAFYERKAQGGAATVCVGSVMADNARGAVGATVRLDDPKALSPHFRLTQCISRHGAVADAELQHCGANAYFSMLGLGNDIYGAYDCVNGMGMEIPGMPEDVILETISKFGDAAMTAKHCGYGMVTVHAGHGWLLNQFLGPGNNRKDRWGGSMENRARIVNAIAADIRKKCGRDFPVCVRISASEIFEGGYGVDYGVEIAKQLDGNYDLINVSVGAHEAPDVFTDTHPSLFLPDGCNVRYAAEVKKAVRYSRISAVGAIAEPELMEEIIASGKADVVAVCRELMADPDMPKKAELGKAGEIRKCVRCFECFSHAFTHLTHCCAVNPEIGFERELRYYEHGAPVKKKVLVAGGGVAGMQAALTCAERGHTVILAEKSGELGGALLCERDVPFKQNLQRYLRQQAERIGKSGIDLRLNTEASPELCRELEPDVIIAALGSRPIVPDFLPGYDGENVLTAERAFLHPEETGENVLILGGGLSGAELAIYLSGLGKRASVMEMADSLNFSGNVVHSMAVKKEIARLGIGVHTSVRAVELRPDGVVGESVGGRYSPPEPCGTLKQGMLQSVINVSGTSDAGPEGERRLYPADTVVIALGQRPEREAADALRGCAPELYCIGDCVEPKNVYAANSVAFTIARDIGKY
ncbi:MAG: FAD-dependent oxidoreductase [Oscillospiraceae bacterium]|nr:FAD-dependent oxidoreductase [Oscillospiraceae bacterium]